MKEKIGKLDFTKMKNFCSGKGTVARRDKPQNGRKIFVKYISDNISQIYRKLLELNNNNKQSN